MRGWMAGNWRASTVHTMEDQEVASLKLKLKRWEKSFMKIHERKPSKSDVPDEILDLYRQYNALKCENRASTSNHGALHSKHSRAVSEERGRKSRRSLWKLPPLRRLSSFADTSNARSQPHPPSATPPDLPVKEEPVIPSSVPTLTARTPDFPTTQPDFPSGSVISPLTSRPHPPATPPDSPHSPSVDTSLPLATLQPRPPVSSPDPPLMMPGHCTFKSSRLKFNNVSREWLDSCRPEWTDMEGESSSLKSTQSIKRQREDDTDQPCQRDIIGLGELASTGASLEATGESKEHESEEKCSIFAEMEREEELVTSQDHRTVPEVTTGERGVEVMGEVGGARRQTVAVERGRSVSSEAVTTTGVVSENFVKLNMKKKKHCRRPGRALSGSAYKRAEWKKRQKGDEKSGRGKGAGRFVCFKCGKSGHWAKNCKDRGGSISLGSFAGQKVDYNESVALGFEEEMDQDMLQELEKESPFPTIGEAAAMVTKSAPGKKTVVASVEALESAMPTQAPPSPGHTPSTMEPLFTMEPDGSIISTPTSVLTALKKLGFSHFRPGQEEAIMRILSGVSTLLITGTGSGKSLCYQLPAYLYRQTRPPCITLVVSPLVSLMDDQVRQFPRGLQGACLHTNQTHPQRDKVLREIAEGKVDVLLLSPEALVGGALWRRKGYGHSLHDLPPVAFACVDEVHCISEWSHNFRPSYLQLHKVLRERLGVKCVLGLTATATHTTGLSVSRHLGVAEENIIRGPTLPDNLRITVSCDQDRDQALLELLDSEPFTSLNSIIIYCTRQHTAETLAQILRTNFQSWNQYQKMEETDSKTPDTSSSTRKPSSSSRRTKSKKTSVFAECYHAGMSAAQRRSVQNKFMTGTVRVVVATVAFGMGLNKADVRAIVHYNMPKSFESFVQEIGRAGRDGDPAYCHVFIDKEGSDLYELYRHAYSNSVDPYAIKKLVERALPLTETKQQTEDQDSMFRAPNSSPPPSDSKAPRGQISSPPPSDSKPPGHSRGHEVAIPIESTVQCLDVREECLSTLLCYMELEGWLEVRSPVYDTCTLKCYGGARQLRALASKVPAVAAAAATLRQKGVDLEGSNHMTFSVIGTADSMGWESGVVRSELMGLQVNDRGTCPSATPSPRGTVLVEMEELAWHVVTCGDVTRSVQDSVIQLLVGRVSEQVMCEVQKMQILHAVLKSVATDTHVGVTKVTEVGGVRSAGSLREIISRYFDRNGFSVSDLAGEGISVSSSLSELSVEEEDLIGRDVATMVNRFSDQCFTGRAVARIFHGIPSPRFPAVVWGAQRGFWRKHIRVDFNTLCQLATKKLLEFMT